MNKSKKPRINVGLMPESMREEHCRVLYGCIRDFFSNMTPAQKEHYDRWSKEYDRKHGLSPENSAIEGGEL